MDQLQIREQWLQDATGLYRPHFKVKEVELPPLVRVACGWPSRNGLSNKKRRMGEAWCAESSIDGVPHLYVSPLAHASVEVLGILAHELIHTGLPMGSGHKAPFKRAGIKLGLTGPAPQMKEGPELMPVIDKIIDLLGPYPQVEINQNALKEREKKADRNRMLKIFCSGGETLGHDQYILRGSKKVLLAGIPQCPVCGLEMIPEEQDEKEEEGE